MGRFWFFFMLALSQPLLASPSLDLVSFAKANVAVSSSSDGRFKWAKELPYETVYFYKISQAALQPMGGTVTSLDLSSINLGMGELDLEAQGVQSLGVDCWALSAPRDKSAQEECIEIIEVDIPMLLDYSKDGEERIAGKILTSHVKGFSKEDDSIIIEEAFVAFEYRDNANHLIEDSVFEATLTGDTLDYTLTIPKARLVSGKLRIVLIDFNKLKDLIDAEATPIPDEARLAAATVWIGDAYGNRYGLGTIISPRGVVLTSQHVLDQLKTMGVSLAECHLATNPARRFQIDGTAKIVRRMKDEVPSLDLAILQLRSNDPESHYPHVQVASPTVYQTFSGVWRFINDYNDSMKMEGWVKASGLLDRESGEFRIKPGSLATESGSGVIDSKTGLLVGVLRGAPTGEGINTNASFSWCVPAHLIPEDYKGEVSGYEQMILLLPESTEESEFKDAVQIGFRFGVKIARYNSAWRGRLRGHESDLPLVGMGWYVNRIDPYPDTLLTLFTRATDYPTILKNYTEAYQGK
jgi:hypothetical protein